MKQEEEEEKEKKMLDVTIEQVKQSDVVDSTDNDIALMSVEGVFAEMRPVRFDCIALIYCTAGELMLEVNDKAFRMAAGNVLFVFPNSVLSGCGTPDFKGKCIFLSIHALKDSFRHERSLIERVFCLGKNPIVRLSDARQDLFDNYYRILSMRMELSAFTYRREVVQALVQAMLYDLLACVEDTEESSGSEMVRQGDILFRRFIELISKSKVKSRFTYDYAEKLHVSTKYLSAVCKNVSGRTATAIINEFVVEDIRRLLKYSDKSIKEIAQELDFPNISFFGKYVKAHLGMSPKAYRKTR